MQITKFKLSDIFTEEAFSTLMAAVKEEVLSAESSEHPSTIIARHMKKDGELMKKLDQLGVDADYLSYAIFYVIANDSDEPESQGPKPPEDLSRN